MNKNLNTSNLTETKEPRHGERVIAFKGMYWVLSTYDCISGKFIAIGEGSEFNATHWKPSVIL